MVDEPRVGCIRRELKCDVVGRPSRDNGAGVVDPSRGDFVRGSNAILGDHVGVSVTGPHSAGRRPHSSDLQLKVGARIVANCGLARSERPPCHCSGTSFHIRRHKGNGGALPLWELIHWFTSN